MRDTVFFFYSNATGPILSYANRINERWTSLNQQTIRTFGGAVSFWFINFAELPNIFWADHWWMRIAPGFPFGLRSDVVVNHPRLFYSKQCPRRITGDYYGQGRFNSLNRNDWNSNTFRSINIRTIIYSNAEECLQFKAPTEYHIELIYYHIAPFQYIGGVFDVILLLETVEIWFFGWFELDQAPASIFSSF